MTAVQGLTPEEYKQLALAQSVIKSVAPLLKLIEAEDATLADYMKLGNTLAAEREAIEALANLNVFTAYRPK